MEVGERVVVRNIKGTIRFVGKTSFSKSNSKDQDKTWLGIELDVPQGKNDGSIDGVRYFNCKNNHGLFVEHGNAKVSVIQSDNEDTQAKRILDNSHSGAVLSSVAAFSVKTSSKTELLRQKKAALDARILANKERQFKRRSKQKITPIIESKLDRECSSSYSEDGKDAPALLVLQKKLSELKIENSERENKIKELNISLRLKNEECENLKNELSNRNYGKQEPSSKSRNSKHNDQSIVMAKNIDELHQNVKLDSKNIPKTHYSAANSLDSTAIPELKAEMERLNDLIESLTLDKEQIKLENELLEDKFEDLNVELETLKEEKAILEEKSRASLADNTNPKSHMSRMPGELLSQNQKMREALRILHKKSNEEKSKLQALTKERDCLLSKLSYVDKLSRENALLKDRNSELQSLVECFESNSNLIESLSEKNIQLTDENESLRKTNEELEELRDIMEEMELQHVEYENQLMKDIEEKEATKNKMQTQKKKLIADIEVKDKVINSLRVEIDAKEEERTSLKQSLREVERLNSEMKQKLQKLYAEVREFAEQNSEVMQLQVEASSFLNTKYGRSATLFRGILWSRISEKEKLVCEFLSYLLLVEHEALTIIHIANVLNANFSRKNFIERSDSMLMPVAFDCFKFSNMFIMILDHISLLERSNIDVFVASWRVRVSSLSKNLQELRNRLMSREFSIQDFRKTIESCQLDLKALDAVTLLKKYDLESKAVQNLAPISKAITCGTLASDMLELLKIYFKTWKENPESNMTDTEINAKDFLRIAICSALGAYNANRILHMYDRVIKVLSDAIDSKFQLEIKFEDSFEVFMKLIKNLLVKEADRLQSHGNIDRALQNLREKIAETKPFDSMCKIMPCRSNFKTDESGFFVTSISIWNRYRGNMPEPKNFKGKPGEDLDSLKRHLKQQTVELQKREIKLKEMEHLCDQLRYKAESAFELARRSDALKLETNALEQKLENEKALNRKNIQTLSKDLELKEDLVIRLKKQLKANHNSYTEPGVWNTKHMLRSDNPQEISSIILLQHARRKAATLNTRTMKGRLALLRPLVSKRTKTKVDTPKFQTNFEMQGVVQHMKNALKLQSRIKIVDLSNCKHFIAWNRDCSGVRQAVSLLSVLQNELNSKQEFSKNSREKFGSIMLYPTGCVRADFAAVKEVVLPAEWATKVPQMLYVTTLST